MLFLLFLIPVLLLLGCQSRIIYYPRANDTESLGRLAQMGGTALRFQTSPGGQMAYYVPPRDRASPPAVVWLVFSGNGSLALDWLGLIQAWDPSFGYLLVDYPGYGDCAGKANPARIRESAPQAVKALAAHLALPEADLQPRLAILGHSLGCAAGLMAANDLQVKRLVLVAPFTTMTDMGRRLLGWPLCHLNLHRFNNRVELKQACETGARVVIFHGTRDGMIPPSMSQELAAAHPSHVTLHLAEGEDHNYILGNISPRINAAMRELAGKK